MSCVFAWKFEVFWVVQPQLRKKNCPVESGSMLAKLSILIKLYPFTWDTEVLWILMERTNSEHPCKIRYSGKELPIFLDTRCSFVVFACFRGKWWRSFLSLLNWQAGIFSGLVNRVVLLNNWISWEVYLFWQYKFLFIFCVIFFVMWIYSLHQNTWIPGRMSLRSSCPEVFLRNGILKIGSKFTGEHPCRSAISIKLKSNFIEIALWLGDFPVNLLHIFRTPFHKNTSGRLLLEPAFFSGKMTWWKNSLL